MYCSHCGIKIEDNATICPHCQSEQNPMKQNDTGILGYGILSILVPIAGLIFYLIWKEERPKTAKSISDLCDHFFCFSDRTDPVIYIIRLWNIVSCWKYWMIGGIL